MSEPSLDITYTTEDIYQTLWEDRLLIRFADMTSELETWSSWADLMYATYGDAEL